METFAEDQEKIHEMLELPYIHDGIKKNVRKSAHKSSTRELAKMYFKDIPAGVKRKLEDIYKIDFEMFSYSPNF